MKSQSRSKSFLLHFRTKSVSADTARVTLSFGLGGAAFILILLQFLSGGLLHFLYVPHPDMAYQSILNIQQFPVGRMIRNIHHISGNLLMGVVFLHFLRVFYTGAYGGKRRLNWIVGLCLFGMIAAANFTGYLLPWDQLSYWAVTICLSMFDYIPIIGEPLQLLFMGDRIGAWTLKLFFSIHTFYIPFGLLAFAGYHFWNIRKAGGLVQRAVPLVPGKISGDVLLIREMIMIGVTLVVVLTLSLCFSAPLHDMANPELTPDNIKAPWYFAGIQELLLHVNPVAGVTLIPFVWFIWLIYMTKVTPDQTTTGVWFGPERQSLKLLVVFFLGIAVTVLILFLDYLNIFDSEKWIPSFMILLLPFITMVISKKMKPDLPSFSVQVGFTCIISIIICLTIVGTFLRGAAMEWLWR